MDRRSELEANSSWRMAVWALRAGYVGLSAAAAGLIVVSSGSTAWVLAIGVAIWLVAAAVTLTGVFRSHHQLADPRPGYWAMRTVLLYDTVHGNRSDRRS